MSTHEDEGTDQVRSCLACSVEGSTLCSRCPEYDILYCSALSMTISLLYCSAKFSSIWLGMEAHLESRAYGLVFPAVSVDDVFEQSVRQLPAHVAKTLEMNLIDFENWDCLTFVLFFHWNCIITLRNFSQSSLTKVKYSREEISWVFSTYLL